MSITRKTITLALLLTVGPCAVHGQSIVISGGQRSIVISGNEPARTQATVSVPLSVPKPQKGSDPKSPASPVVAVDQSRNAQQAAGEVFRTTVSERYLISEEWCPNCPAAKTQFLRSGGKPENVITIKQARDIGYRNPNWSGGIPHQFTLQTVVETHASQLTSQPHRVQSRNVADQPQNYTEAQRQNDIDHLLTHRSHAGKFTREYLESLSGYQLIDLHNNDHGVPTVKGQKIGSVSVQQRLPVVETKWGTIDLETYQRNCDCPMCQGIRALQQQYRQTSLVRPVSAAQEPTPDDVLQDVINLLALSPSDKLADLGCGDGRVLIAAVERYGCTAIGVEIDPQKADEARRNVQAAGLSNKVTIVTDDALRFWPADNGVTAAVAYLYPDLLEQLRPNLEQVRLVVTPFHQVPGMQMDQVGDVWVRRIGT